MADRMVERNGVPVLVVDDDGPEIADPLELIGATYGYDTSVVAVPVQRLDPRFFQLSTGVAGEMLQKFANYRLRLAVVGDISAQRAASNSLNALVIESNRGRHVWFVADLDELDQHLS